MSLILEFLKSVFEKIKSDSRFFYWIVIIVLLIILFFTSKSCQNAKLDALISKNNVEAIQDKLRTEKNKAGEVEYLRRSLVADMESLKDLNSSLYDEVKKMKGEVLVMSKNMIDIEGTLVGIEINTRGQKPIKLKNDTLVVPYTFTDGNEKKTWSREVIGESVVLMKNITDSTYALPLYNKLKSDKMSLQIFSSLRKREDDGKFEFVLRTDYPNVTLNPEGFIDPSVFATNNTSLTQDKWIIGPYIGVGVNNTFGITPQIGIGLTYRIIGF